MKSKWSNSEHNVISILFKDKEITIMKAKNKKTEEIKSVAFEK